MDSADEYEEETVTYAIGRYEEEVERGSHSSSSSHSEHGSDSDDSPPPILSPPHHTMVIPSVRRSPVPVLVPADRVSTHDLPLADTLAAVDRELFHTSL